MFGDFVRPTMSCGLLLFLAISLAISGTVEERLRKQTSELAADGMMGACPRIRSHTPDNLHFMMTSSKSQDLAAFYKSGDSGKMSPSGPQQSSNSSQQSDSQKPQQTRDKDTNRIGLSEEVTGFQPHQEQDITDQCINVGPCVRTAKYRTINGTCNNFNFLMWGVTTSALVRLLPANYQDDTVEGRLLKQTSELAADGMMGACPRIRSHTPDNLHFMMTSSKSQDLAAFYKSGDSGKMSPSGPQQSSNSSQQSDSQKPQQTRDKDTNRIGLSEEVTGFQPHQEQDIADQCINVGPCDRTAKYRTINGTCNNFNFPMWGVTASALVRLLPANYQDGDHSLRKAQSGKELPNVRQLSSSLFIDRNAPDGINMYNVMQWGQLIAHDTTHIVQQDSENQGLDCCQPPCAFHTDICAPIEVSLNDPFFSQYHLTCLNVVRSATTTNLKCPLSPQQQVIAVTHFVDASLVYGSTVKVASKLRTYRDGLLEARPDEKREFPPQSDTPSSDCDNAGSDQICYATGDDRVNQNTGITLLQIVLFREHNRLARELKNLNPQWDDEKLYQEARRIVGAQVQRITYEAYLPIILGKEYLKSKGLVVGYGDEDFINDYDEFLNPSTLNSFATAAYRAFHSQIPREIVLYDEGFNPIRTLKIDDSYFSPCHIQEPYMLDKLLRGQAVQPAQGQDQFFSVAITHFLFKSSKPYGKDLESIDMQRGRDHGLATYADFRRACGLRPVSHFEELINFMHQDAVQALQSKYESVEDIDLFVGGMLETRVPGGLVGPTFACIIGEQFLRWRNGDRFFYESGDQAGSFKLNQLKEIRKVTLAELFCQNGDDIDRMTSNVFHAPDALNPIKSCKNIIKMDLSPWKEN